MSERYRQTFPKIHYFDVNTEDLNKPATVLEMFRFGLEPKESLQRIIGTPVNTKSEYKAAVD